MTLSTEKAIQNPQTRTDYFLNINYNAVGHVGASQFCRINGIRGDYLLEYVGKKVYAKGHIDAEDRRFSMRFVGRDRVFEYYLAEEVSE